MPAETRSKAMKSGSWSSYQAAAELPDRDDEEDVPAVEVITGSCLGCGKPIRYPVDAEGDDCCCSDACIKAVCARMDAEIEEAYAALFPAGHGSTALEIQTRWTAAGARRAAPVPVSFRGVPY